MKRILPLVFFFLLVSPVRSEMLLAVFSSGGDTQPQGQFLPGFLRFSFGIGEDAPFGNSATMNRYYPDVSQGSVSEATIEELAAMNAIIASVHPHHLSISTLNVPGVPAGITSWVVPQLGPGLTGYRLTRVTQTINILEFYEDRHIPGVVLTGARGQQTLVLWGVVAPEPSALALLLLGLSHVCLSRRRLP